jgi:hypothetical protein
LNFTKKRLSEGEIDVLINNSKYKSRLIKVNDKYGDYGIVGFYAFDEKKNRLEHFVFSCRIINLGVAQYVYQKLNTPSIEIIPEVSEQLDGLDPTWINEKIIDTVNISNSVEKDDRIKIFFKGGCDLDQMLFYLGDKYYDIHQETNYVCGNGFPIHQEHSQVLIDSVELGNDKKDFVIENIPFTDESFYETKVFEGDYNCLIYSVLMDYTQDIYISNDKTIKLPFGGYGEIWTNENEHNKIIEKFNNRGIKIVTKEKLNFFKNNFYYQGQISPENFIRNLKKIRKMINELIPIIVINGAEVLSPNAKEAEATKRHILMNNAVDDYVLNTPNIYLLDLRNIVTSEKQLLNSIRHYKRDVYKQMAEELLKLLNNIFNNDISTKISNHSFTRYKMLLKKTIKTINSILKI